MKNHYTKRHPYLKPCPFCGEEQNQDWQTGELNAYAGQNRQCSTCGVAHWDWNNRPIEDALNKRIAELESKRR